MRNGIKRVHILAPRSLPCIIHNHYSTPNYNNLVSPDFNTYKPRYGRPTIVLSNQDAQSTGVAWQGRRTDENGNVMTKEQFDKEKAFYTAQISLFERERNVAGLQSIVQKVVNQQLPPTPGIINRLVTSLHRLSCSSDIYALFRHLTHVGSPMPIIVCNAFLAHYTSMRDATKVQLVMSIMRSTKLEPDLYTFNSLLKYAIGKGDNNEVQQVLRDMARHDISPDVVSYNQILTPLAKSGNFEECQKVLDQMKQRGVEPDVATYTILIEAHARAGDWTKCDSLIGEMTKNDVEKDVRIYNAMMTQASFKRDWRRCDQIWNQIRKEGLTSKVTYNVRMRVCLMRDKMEEVTQIMNEMKENDIPLDSDSYLSLIRGAADLGNHIFVK